MCNVAGIFVQWTCAKNVKYLCTSACGHIIGCIEFINCHSCFICTCKVIGIYGIYVAFEGHI